MSSYAKRFSRSNYLGDKSKLLETLSSGKVVVHLGCTDWPNQVEQISKQNLLHIKLLKVARHAVGVDVDMDGINHLKQLYEKEDFICGDISTSTEIQRNLINLEPDFLFIPDVLEHIENSRDFLMGIEKVLSGTNATAIFTTPNAFALKTFIPVFFGLDFTHPDHCSIHNEFTIIHVMKDANLKVKTVNYCSRDISERYGMFLQIVTKPFDWFCHVFPRFADTLYVEVTAN